MASISSRWRGGPRASPSARRSWTRARWNRAKAARMLGISYKALLYKLIDLGLVTRVS
jgi:DNA-binding NtrC family response regulator